MVVTPPSRRGRPDRRSVEARIGDDHDGRPWVDASSRSVAITPSAVLVSRAAVGSSPITIGGLPPRARAMATRCF
jgi:hypothetical protein